MTEREWRSGAPRFGASGLEFRLQDLGFGVEGLGFGASGVECRAQDLGFGVWGFGFLVDLIFPLGFRC